MSCSHSNKPASEGSNAVPSCKDCIDFLIDYLDGTLPAAKRSEFELHLELCPPCHRYLMQYQTTVRLGQAAMKEVVCNDPPPEGLIAAILAARNAGKGTSPRSDEPPANGPSTHEVRE